MNYFVVIDATIFLILIAMDKIVPIKIEPLINITNKDFSPCRMGTIPPDRLNNTPMTAIPTTIKNIFLIIIISPLISLISTLYKSGMNMK